MVACWKIPAIEGGNAHADQAATLEPVPSWEYKNPEVDQLVLDLKKEKDILAIRKIDLDDVQARLANERSEIEKNDAPGGDQTERDG